MALSTGVKEAYAKEVYFKRLANEDLFIGKTTDPVTGDEVHYLKSSSELTTEEMSRAINNFRRWAEEQGYYLPDAAIDEADRVVFASEEDEKAFKQAELETERAGMYID